MDNKREKTNSNNNDQRNSKGLFQNNHMALCCLASTHSSWNKSLNTCLWRKIIIKCVWIFGRSWKLMFRTIIRWKAKRNNERLSQYGFGDSFVEIKTHFNSIEMFNSLKISAFSHGSRLIDFFFLQSCHTKESSLLNFMLCIGIERNGYCESIGWLRRLWPFVRYEKWPIPMPFNDQCSHFKFRILSLCLVSFDLTSVIIWTLERIHMIYSSSFVISLKCFCIN